MTMRLNPYMGHTGSPADGAVLVFACNAREARVLAFGELCGWFNECRYIDVRAERLRLHVDYLATLADRDKLAAGTPHVIDDPQSCPTCERWGVPPSEDGRTCLHCIDEEAIGG
jgi:hypothetical protein